MSVQTITYVNIKATRGKNKNCDICLKEFSFSNSEHQCKRCKRAVCEKCASSKAHNIKKAGELSSKPHRQCNICKDESEAMKQFIEQYKIAYGVDSFAREWLRDYGQLETAQRDYKAARENIKAIERTEITGFDNINYSLQDFYYLLSPDPNKVKQVIITLISKYSDIPFSAELVVLANFLLCFSSEASAFALLVIIYKQILPQQFTKNTDFKQEQVMIMNVCKAMDFKEEDVIQKFMENRIRRYISTFSLNMFLFETSFFLINQLFMKYETFVKLIGVSLILNVDAIKKGGFDESELYILRNLRSSQLSQNQLQIKGVKLSQEFSINQDLVGQLREEIAQLKVQLAHKSNEIEGLKVKSSPDMAKSYLDKKNDELHLMMKKVASLEHENQALKENEAKLQQELNTRVPSSDYDYIEKLQKQLEYYQVAQSNPKSKDSNQDYAQISQHRQEIDLLTQKVDDLEQQNYRLLQTVEIQKASLLDIQKTLSNINSSPGDLIELSNNKLGKTKTDVDDQKHLIETKNCQNQLLKTILKQKQQFIRNFQVQQLDVNRQINMLKVTLDLIIKNNM